LFHDRESIPLIDSGSRIVESSRKTAANENEKPCFIIVPHILTGRAWVRWGIIITMFDVAIEKLWANQRINPVIRTWEVKRKGNHAYSIVYRVFDTLLKGRIVVALEPLVDRNEVKFTKNGLHVLKQEINFWNRVEGSKQGVLESLRLRTLTERIREFEGHVGLEM
jgi:hypothetical protein